ncbi:MAG: hypothetical protein ACTS6G_03845 [Candidatus Hodgkinia cicadicola]
MRNVPLSVVRFMLECADKFTEGNGARRFVRTKWNQRTRTY